jgi:type II secretory ATPase GspE/PulE/Tfp pilus assembly ATPase PilB-like protein
MSELLAQVPPPGGYFSLAKILAMLVVVTPWLYLAPHVARDVRNVRAPAAVWEASLLAAGGLGFLVWLLVGQFFIGLVIFVGLAYGTAAAYLLYRNGRVDEEAKISLGKLFSGKAASKPTHTVNARVKLYASDGRNVPAPAADAPEQLVLAYNLAQDMLYDVLWRRASEVDIMPAGPQSRVRFVIDGVPTEGETMPLAESELLVQYLKGVAGSEVEERRRPQRGKISVDLAGSQVDILIATAGTTGGQRMQMRIRQEFVQTNIEQLGLPGEMLKRLREVSLSGSGLMIVSGRSGNGVTSTIYSLLREQDAFIKQVFTLEMRPDVDLENITQVSYAREDELRNQLASTLRRDPDVVMVDQCPDAEIAELVHSAASEKLMLLGMTASDTFSALAKWIKVCGNTECVDNLQLIVNQVLVRKLCPTCREPYRPDPQMLAKANLPAKGVEHFYRPPSQPLVDEKGNPYSCPTCRGSGYFGRTGVFEMLDMTDDLRELIRKGASLSQIKSAARKNRMLYLQEQALRKVMEGITSVQEVVRVTQAQKANKAEK